jgi:hypothetical protein
MSVAFRVFVGVLGILLAAGPSHARPGVKPTQYVIISFDGAHKIAQWKRSRALAKETGATFTYFLSCVYLLTRETRGLYKAPGKRAGRSNVGFAQSKAEVGHRLEQIWAAHNEGQDIGSHACGHFDGAKWSKADWESELDAFSSIVGEAYANNGIAGEPAGWRDFAANIRGFRVPYLSTGKALYQALAEKGYAYDASGVSRGPARPESRGGIARFSLPLIPEGPNGRSVIAMDYNLFVRHSDGIEKKDVGAVFENRTYQAFRTAFDKQYDGERIPLELGFHFTLMNGGAYWRALERLARDVCRREDVACVSYADYLKRMPVSGAGDGVVGG